MPDKIREATPSKAAMELVRVILCPFHVLVGSVLIWILARIKWACVSVVIVMFIIGESVIVGQNLLSQDVACKGIFAKWNIGKWSSAGAGVPNKPPNVDMRLGVDRVVLFPQEHGFSHGLFPLPICRLSGLEVSGASPFFEGGGLKLQSSSNGNVRLPPYVFSDYIDKDSALVSAQLHPAEIDNGVSSALGRFLLLQASQSAGGVSLNLGDSQLLFDSFGRIGRILARLSRGDIGHVRLSDHFLKLSVEYDSSSNPYQNTENSKNNQSSFKTTHWLYLSLVQIGVGCAGISWGVFYTFRNGWGRGFGVLALVGGTVVCAHGVYLLLDNSLRGYRKIVTHKSLTHSNYCVTLIDMANILNTDKQIAVIGALAEGSSIRSIERITGVHRDTIMRLGVKVGKGCAALMDTKMRDLPCHYLEFDEIWGFIGKKEKHVTVDDSPELGDVWTFCAVDAETKLVPTFRCGKRDRATANAFVQDVASRMKNRVQISTDGLRAYVEAIEKSFGADVDYAQIVKTYTHDVEMQPNRRYSAPEIVTTEKKIFSGSPDISRISTSYVERLNGTTRTHMRRLTRLTLAFSKKLENFEAAVGLHFAYYNFVKRHNTLRCTPAMAAGIERDFLSVGDLVEASA